MPLTRKPPLRSPPETGYCFVSRSHASGINERSPLAKPADFFQNRVVFNTQFVGVNKILLSSTKKCWRQQKFVDRNKKLVDGNIQLVGGNKILLAATSNLLTATKSLLAATPN